MSTQMHGKSHRAIANKCGSLEQYERWAKQYIEGDLSASAEGVTVKVSVDTKDGFAVSTKQRQIANAKVADDAFLFYSHLVKAKQTYMQGPEDKKKKVTVEHSFWFDVTKALTTKRKAEIEEASKIKRVALEA